jgi:trk system potassium uptake protein TrkH
MVYTLSVLITMYYYQNIPQVLFEVASAMSNVGLTTNLITANSPVIVKLTFIVDMWTGRLEIWPILLLVAIGASNIIRK